MTELNSKFELRPGDAIQVADLTQLEAFEDIVAEHVDPDVSQKMLEAWQGRVALKDLLRPPRFNGDIIDIEFVAMAEPYQRLIDANDRGWTFLQAFRFSRTSTLKATIDSCVGFTFSANARSTGRGVIGQIQAEVWYGRVPTIGKILQQTRKDGSVGTYHTRYRATEPYGGMGVKRYITKPKLEAERFIELDKTAKKIGLNVLRKQMIYPLVQPIRQ